MTAAFRKGPERVVYEGHVITVVVGEFVAPDGAVLQRDLVRHRGAVAVVPLIGDEVVMVRQYRAALDGLLLEIPAGLRDVDGEPPEQTAVRELAEEIGMRPGHLELMTRFYNAAGFSDEEIIVYLATDLTDVPLEAQGAEEEHMTIERVRLADVDTMIASGELCDAKSIIGLLLARRHVHG